MSYPASKTTRKKVKKNRAEGVKVVKMQITSLVDMMTVLLVFLLKSFSAEGDIMTPSKGLVLPSSTAKKKPEIAFRISITQEDLLVEGSPVVSIDNMMKREDIIVPELAQILDARRKATERIAQNSTNVTFKGEVLIEADKKIQFRTLQRIMYTCGQAGFSNFSLLVLSKES
jgi:biopolymer transport protein ExbD